MVHKIPHQSPQRAISMTSCWGVKYLVMSHEADAGKAADGVPHDEISIALAFWVSSWGTSALYIPCCQHSGLASMKTVLLTFQNQM